MNKRTIGIDTSNYRTSAASYEIEGGSYVQQGALLTVEQGQLGLRQSDALFQHIKQLDAQLAALPKGQTCAIGVSTRPRAVEGSYMPCFLAGVSAARSAGALLDVPVFAVSHQQGHIAAAAFGAGRLDLLDRPFLAWHLSGGTTELLRVMPDACGLPDCKCVGGTTDLSAGQLVDRVGVSMQLAFPAGAALDRLALSAPAQKGFAVKVRDGYFSLSGMQNQADTRRTAQNPENLARFVLDTIARTVITATRQLLQNEPLPVLCAGGVMASAVLQDRLRRELPEVYFAPPALSGDNAVGAAILAARLLQRRGG